MIDDTIIECFYLYIKLLNRFMRSTTLTESFTNFREPYKLKKSSFELFSETLQNEFYFIKFLGSKFVCNLIFAIPLTFKTRKTHVYAYLRQVPKDGNIYKI
jgi:hypothetical protein